MGRDLSYYSVNTANGLVEDIAETWGWGLERMGQDDQVWLLYQLADHSVRFLDADTEYSAEVDEVVERFKSELSKADIGNLIQALANKGCKPMGYWNLDHDNDLIYDIAHVWGDSLTEMSEFDQMWLIARLAGHFWSRWCESPSDEAIEVMERASELDDCDVWGLVQALANK
ncbi:MAG: hypothetical protein ACFCUV_22375 [Rivularia sp. (in: cyanobacteria)]